MYDFIKDRLKDIGKTQKDLAEHIGIQPPHLSAIFKGIRKIQSSEIFPIAKFLGIDVETLTKKIAGEKAELIPSTPINFIYKVGYVQAGQWNEACQLPEDDWEEIPYPTNDKYNNKKIFALGVKGDSMNKVFPPDTTTLICCQTNEYLEKNKISEIQNDKYIIAYRTRADGQCEATVKKYMKTDSNTVILVAESTNPLMTNIILHPDDNEYTIAAVVISAVRDY